MPWPSSLVMAGLLVQPFWRPKVWQLKELVNNARYENSQNANCFTHHGLDSKLREGSYGTVFGDGREEPLLYLSIIPRWYEIREGTWQVFTLSGLWGTHLTGKWLIQAKKHWQSRSKAFFKYDKNDTMFNYSCILVFIYMLLQVCRYCICTRNKRAKYCIVSLFGGDVCSEKKSSRGVMKGKWKVTITRLGQYYDKKPNKQVGSFHT